MPKHPEEGQLKTKSKDSPCFQIEAIKKEICGCVHTDIHKVERASTSHGERDITSWSEKHHFITGYGEKSHRADIHFLSKPTPSPTIRNFSVDITFQGNWRNSAAYEKIKDILKKNGFELEKDKWPFADRTDTGLAASRNMEKRIQAGGWHVHRNF
jgi:hypothetical protein